MEPNPLLQLHRRHGGVREGPPGTCSAHGEGEGGVAGGGWSQAFARERCVCVCVFIDIAFDLLGVRAAKVGKPVEEVLRYGEVFWRRGPKVFSEEAWKRIKSRVETKEKRLNEVSYCCKDQIIIYMNIWIYLCV